MHNEAALAAVFWVFFELFVMSYRFYPDCDVWLNHQDKVEEFSKYPLLKLGRSKTGFERKSTCVGSIWDILRNPPIYLDGQVKHHIQGRSDSVRSFQHWWYLCGLFDLLGLYLINTDALVGTNTSQRVIKMHLRVSWNKWCNMDFASFPLDKQVNP